VYLAEAAIVMGRGVKLISGSSSESQFSRKRCHHNIDDLLDDIMDLIPFAPPNMHARTST
jgi:hypothetical protein